MTEEEWLTCQDAREMLGRCPHSFSKRKRRLVAVACCRCSRQLLLNADLRAAVELAERFADGEASERELAAVYTRLDEYAGGLYESGTEREIHRWNEAVAAMNATRANDADVGDAVWHVNRAATRKSIGPKMAELLRDIVGNPYRPVAFSPECRTDTVLSLASQMYDSRDFSAVPILADALEDAGCADEDILNHCRDTGRFHARGCWVVDLMLGKQ